MKCPVSSCQFATIGFKTAGAAAAHFQKFHTETPQWTISTSPSESLSSDEVEVLLFELVKAGDLGGLQRLVSCYPRIDDSGHHARMLAVTMGSVEMMEVLTPRNSRWLTWSAEPKAQLINALVKSEKILLVRWFLNKVREAAGEDIIAAYNIFVRAVLSTNSEGVYAEWEYFLFEPDDHSGGWGFSVGGLFRPVKELGLAHHKRSVLFSQIAFNATKSAFLEARLIRTWHRLIDTLGCDRLDPQLLGWSLTCLARSSNPSITLASELLSLGAPINFPRGCIYPRNAEAGRKYRPSLQPERHRGMTSLHIAARKTSEGSVRLVRFLLEQGAEPEYGFSKSKPAQEKGAECMQQFLNETWDEVVARTKSKRGHIERGLDSPDEREDSSNADEDAHQGDDEHSEDNASKGTKNKAKTRKRRKIGHDFKAA